VAPEIIRRDPQFEWVLLNYNSADGLHEFMRKQLPSLPSRILYLREQSGRPWHLSVAKNIAHRLASGNILVNLDCDNFIGDAGTVVREQCLKGAAVVHLWSGRWRDGTCGRIAIVRDLFYALGGYDESFHPMGYQDRDLLNRAAATGAAVVHCPGSSALAIPNGKDESMRHCRGALAWEECMEANKRQSQANIAAGCLAANGQTDWGFIRGELITGQNEHPPAIGAARVP